MNTSETPVRALVVDDSALYRKIVRDVLSALPGVEVVGTASNGRIALEQIQSLRPDVVTLDLEMPEVDGIEVLRSLSGDRQAPAAIMVSAFTARGAQATTQALGLGAFDFILKPSTGSMEESVSQLTKDLAPKIEACRRRRRPAAAVVPTARAPRPPMPAPRKPRVTPQVVAVAVSTGGPKTLVSLLPTIPANFPCPIVLVQHMPPMFTASLAEDLDRRCSLKVSEGRHGQIVQAGEIVIAPGGKQMRVAREEGHVVIQITDDPAERNCKPAADYLFRSVAETYGGAAVGVVLTGMGDDGTLGCADLKRQGATILAQDEATSVVYGMPRAVAEAGHVDIVSPMGDIVDHLTRLTRKGAFA